VRVAAVDDQRVAAVTRGWSVGPRPEREVAPGPFALVGLGRGVEAVDGYDAEVAHEVFGLAAVSGAPVSVSTAGAGVVCRHSLRLVPSV
jgi:hypothetical protein